MQRFEFKLERVLRFKKLREKAAEVRQKQTAAALKMIQDEIVSLQDRLGQTAEVVERQLGEIVLPLEPRLAQASWLACYSQAMRIGKALEDAEKKAQEAKCLLLEANAQRKQAAIEVEGVLTLRKRQRETYQRANQRREQERGDEFALRRWQGAQKESGEKEVP